MRLLFFGLLAFHIVHSMVHFFGRRKGGDSRPKPRLLTATQLAIFSLAVVFAYQDGAFSRSLLSPHYIALGFLAGHLIFGLSLLITHRSLEDASSHFLDLNAVWGFIIEHPYVLSRFVYVAISEEVIWRVAAQPLAIERLGPALGILLVAAGFTLVHEHFFKNSILVSLEFVGFAFLLGMLYYWTGSLILVIIIHAARNIEISYLEHVIKIHELGSEEEADRELEKIYLNPRSKGSHGQGLSRGT